MNSQVLRPRTGRRRLFATTELGSIQDREGLAALARSGYAGLRLAGHHVMTDMCDRDLVALIALLRDASGVGLRVSWSGDGGDHDLGSLQHLDPPHRSDGTLAWSPQPGRALVARRGPTFIAVDDTRHGPRRRIDIDRSGPEANILEDDDWGRRISPVDRPGLHRLALDDLAFSSGDYCVGLAVRRGVWCV